MLANLVQNISSFYFQKALVLNSKHDLLVAVELKKKKYVEVH